MSLQKRRITKKEIKASNRYLGLSSKILSCKQCGLEVENVSADAATVICSTCVVKMVAPPDIPAKQKPLEERRPRGWQFMNEYRSPDGILYRRGVKVDETELVPPDKKVDRRTNKRQPDPASSDDTNNTNLRSKGRKKSTPRSGKPIPKIKSNQRSSRRSNRSTK